MKAQITRRGLVAVAILPAAAQQTAVPPAAPVTADDELAAARAQLRSNLQQIGKVKLSIATEPAVHFKA